MIKNQKTENEIEWKILATNLAPKTRPMLSSRYMVIIIKCLGSMIQGLSPELMKSITTLQQNKAF